MRPQRACSDKILVIDFAFQLLMTAPCMPVPSPGDLWCGHGFCVYFTASEPQSLPRLGARLSLTPQHHDPGPDPRLTPPLARAWIQPRPFLPPWGFCVCWALRASERGISLPCARQASPPAHTVQGSLTSHHRLVQSPLPLLATDPHASLSKDLDMRCSEASGTHDH